MFLAGLYLREVIQPWKFREGKAEVSGCDQRGGIGRVRVARLGGGTPAPAPAPIEAGTLNHPAP